MRYNILILHDIEDISNARRTHVDHLVFLERYSPDKNNYFYHCMRKPITSAFRRIPFHVVILNTTALAFCRYYRPRETYHEFLDTWSFMSTEDAVKIAFPQDDYHQTHDIDRMFKDWGVDIIYSVRPEHGSILYPESIERAEIKGVYSGYVDDDSIELLAEKCMPFGEREFDIVQRVTMHPPWGGRFSQIKGNMAKRFEEICRNETTLRVSISVNPEDVLNGDEWMSLLGKGRFALGSEGGVSLWDPDGVILDRSLRFMVENPDAGFCDVEERCFPGEDGRFEFTGFTPRLFEYAIMGCSPILTEGQYRNILRPWEHYIPVRRDLSDVREALDAAKDWGDAKRRVDACRDTLVDNPKFRYSWLARTVMEDVEHYSKGRGIREMSRRAFRRAVDKHRIEQARLSPLIPMARAPATRLERSPVARVVDRVPRFLRDHTSKRMEAIFGEAALRDILLYEYRDP